MFCSNCGKELPGEPKFCFHCGFPTTNCNANGTIESAIGQQYSTHDNDNSIGEKSFVTTMILSMLPAPWGIHRMYVGRPISGIIQFFTGGLYFVWSIIDVFRIVTNNFTDGQGKKLKGYNKKTALLAFIIWGFALGGFIKAIANSAQQAQQQTETVNQEKNTKAQPSKISKADTTNLAENADDEETNKVVTVSTQQEQQQTETIEQEKSTESQSLKVSSKNESLPQSNSTNADTSDLAENIDNEKTAKNKTSALRNESSSLSSSSSTPAITSSASPSPKVQHKAEIADGAIYKYPETAKGLKEAGYPKMLKKYGVEGFKKINSLLPKVAEKASLNPTMDRIVNVDIADSRSTKNKFIFYVDAENHNRLYIAEDDLKSNTPILSNQEKLKSLLPQHEKMCEQIIKNNLTHPSTYKKSYFDSASQTQEYTNVIRIAFSAKNSFNLKINYVAIFRINADSKIIYQDIQEKQ